MTSEQRTNDRTHSAVIDIVAPAQRVWDLLTDVRNMGRWSPVCYRCEWIGEPAAPVQGARFRGHNKLWGWRWSRECVVRKAIPGEVFAFTTLLRGHESVRWTYTFSVSNGRTRVQESYEIVREPLYLKLMPHIARAFRRASRRGMDTTLQRVKAAAEAAS